MEYTHDGSSDRDRVSRMKENLEKATVENLRVRRKWKRVREGPRGIPSAGGF